MTKSQMQQMVKVASKLTTDELKLKVAEYAELFDEYADDILSALLSALKPRMSESDYVEFLDAI